LRGAAQIFAVDPETHRLQIARRFGATDTLLASSQPVENILAETDGRGVDVSIEALGLQETLENALRVLRPGGTLSSVGVYSGHLRIPLDAFGAGLADQTIVTTLCPGGKDRMRRLMRLVQARRIELAPLLTHWFTLDRITEAYDLFAQRKDNVLKVAIEV
jgi:alcohol dehydrogenase